MSNIINVKEERNVLSFASEVFDIVANSTNFYLKFEFDEEWLESSIFTVIFDFDGEKKYVELDEDYKCAIPAANSSKILFCVTTEPSATEKLSSTILSLNVEPSGDTCLENSPNYQASRNELLQIIEDLKAGEIQANVANYATKAGTSETQVSLTGNEDIAGVKNFTGTLKTNSVIVPNSQDIGNPNLLINGDFIIDSRGSGFYTRSGTDIYTVDRWGLFNANGKFQQPYKKLIGTDESGPVIFCQWLEESSKFCFGKTLTISAKIDGVLRSKTIDLPSSFTEDYINNIYETTGYTFRAYVIKNKLRFGVQFLVNNGVSIIIDEVKLEQSSFPTRYHQRPKGEEILLCQRYYQKVRVYTLGYALNAGKLFFQVPLPTTMCAPKTFSVAVTPKILKDGNLVEVTNMKYHQLNDNGIIISAEGENFDTSGYYVLLNGVFNLDGEYY